MKQRMRIPVSSIEQHVNDIYLLVEIDYTYIQVAVPRVRWFKLLGYKLDVDQALAAITTLIAEDIDKDAKTFGTYDVVKSKVEMELKIAFVVKRNDKLVRKIKNEFGTNILNHFGQSILRISYSPLIP